MVNPGTPEKKKNPPAKRCSPGRKKGTGQSLKATLAKKKAGKSIPTLYVWAVAPELNLEIYTYTMNANNDGYTFPFKQYASGDKKVDMLEEANFVSLKFRKMPGSNNVIMLDEKGYWRCVMLRNPPTGSSTVETRTEGLKILKTFFMDPDSTAYPPKDIVMHDQSNVTEPHALGDFLQDHDVMEVLKETFEEDDLDDLFFNMYPELAQQIWNRPYPECAYSLGFPKPL